MTTPTVEQATAALINSVASGRRMEGFMRAKDALIAAVRAEERAKSQPFDVGALIRDRDTAERQLAEERQQRAALIAVVKAVDDLRPDDDADVVPRLQRIASAVLAQEDTPTRAEWASVGVSNPLPDGTGEP